MSRRPFGSERCAAMVGHFTYKSRALGKVVTSLFAVFVKFIDGR